MITESHIKPKNLIQEKSFEFAVSIVKYSKQLRTQNELTIANHLLRSGTSVGANVEEALAGSSKKDFIHKMTVALEESHESKYSLRLIHESDIDKNNSNLMEEANSLVNILSKIIKTSKDVSGNKE